MESDLGSGLLLLPGHFLNYDFNLPPLCGSKIRK